jgi:NAD(P)H-nitrite reductase large subunit
VVGERGGIRIDSHCRTSNPDIYAIGECALWDGRIFGLVAPGYQMAEVAARHIAGETNVQFLGADLSTKLKLMGVDTAPMSDEDIQQVVAERARAFRDEAPTTAAEAAKIILDGVRAERWRILVGDDAHKLDERVRQSPEKAYTPEFYQSLAKEVGWRIG